MTTAARLERLVRPRRTRERIITLAWRKLGQVGCQHDWLKTQQRDRMFLRCWLCGAESQGFRLGKE